MDKPEYFTRVPSYMLNGPHMVYVNGILVHPGTNNDYTLRALDAEETDILWWHPIFDRSIVRLKEVTVAIVRLDTGERWGFSNKEGIFIDTRLQSINL